MAEPTEALPPADSKFAYQPVSGWAVAGLVLGVLIALLVLGNFLLSVYSGQSSFLSGWTMVIGIAGIVVSFIGKQHVSSSEGTRTGSGLAGWGLWLSLLSVLGYFTFSMMTDQALYQQANAFLTEKDDTTEAIPDSGFLPRLIEAGRDRTEANRAFLLTMPSASRAGNPADEKEMQARYDIAGPKGEGSRLSVFRQNFLVRFLEAYGGVEPGSIKIEPMARAGCEYDSKIRCYKVKRHYRITTPETILDILVQANSDESPEPGVRRKWIVALPALEEVNRRTTPLGENLKTYRVDAFSYLQKWAKSQKAGEIPIKDTTSYEKLLPEMLLRDHALSRLKTAGATDLQFVPPSQIMVSPWKEVDGKVQLFQPVHIVIDGRVGPIIPTFQLSGTIILESATPVDPRSPTADTPRWNIISLEWNQVLGLGRKK